jgi:sigma-54 specific flagellar transcriptional regulator A
MTQDLKVAIIDDDKLSTHNWKILLNFINEEMLAFNAEQWKEFVNDNPDNNQVFAVIIGNLMALAFNNSAQEELIKSIHQAYPKMPILLNCEQDFIHNNIPDDSQSWLIQLPDAMEYKTLLQHLDYARQLHGIELKQIKSKIISEHGTPLFRTLAGNSEVITEVKDLIQQVSSKNLNVLLLGESGTGKEIVARNIHYHSGRGDKPFVIVNCAAQGEHFEVALFGCISGYQGINEQRIGYLEQADGGTLFLDKIAEMPSELQAKLANFLEEKKVQKLGDSSLKAVDIRVVVATNTDLKQKVDAGEFREDLYYLLNVLPITMPALRERPEDIPELIKELVIRLEHEGQKAIRLNSSATDVLKNYSWPGNVRELTNLVERLSVIHEGKIIGLNELLPEYRKSSSAEEILEEKENDAVDSLGSRDKTIKANTDVELTEIAKEKETETEKTQSTAEPEKVFLKIMTPLKADNIEEYLNSFEKEIIETALEDAAGMKSFAAERLGLEEDVLLQKMQEFEL